MTSGGPRNRSGPRPDPASARADRAGLVYRLLPREGFTGKPPRFPLPSSTARERALWRELWHTPQAAMWASESWRHYSIALYTRWAVRAEEPDANASLLTSLHRFADQLGLTPAGLKENGWRLASEEPAVSREGDRAPRAREITTRRLRLVVDGGDASRDIEDD